MWIIASSEKISRVTTGVCLCKLDTIKVLVMLHIMQDFANRQMLIPENVVPSLRYWDTNLTKCWFKNIY
jgi:hypothetical protein